MSIARKLCGRSCRKSASRPPTKMRQLQHAKSIDMSQGIDLTETYDCCFNNDRAHESVVERVMRRKAY